MNKQIIAILILPIMLPFNAYALDWSCPEMQGFVDKMYEAGDYINKKPNFDENLGMEKNIDQLMSILKAIAADEEMDAFTDAVKDMNLVWQKEEWQGDDIGDFRRALDSVNVNLERVYEKYCDQ